MKFQKGILLINIINVPGTLYLQLQTHTMKSVVFLSHFNKVTLCIVRYEIWYIYLTLHASVITVY